MMSVDGMMGMGWMMGGWFLIILLIIVALVLLAIWLARHATSQPAVAETALDILKRRYAKGEIDSDQFEQMKRQLSA